MEMLPAATPPSVFDQLKVLPPESLRVTNALASEWPSRPLKVPSPSRKYLGILVQKCRESKRTHKLGICKICKRRSVALCVSGHSLSISRKFVRRLADSGLDGHAYKSKRIGHVLRKYPELASRCQGNSILIVGDPEGSHYAE